MSNPKSLGKTAQCSCTCKLQCLDIQFWSDVQMSSVFWWCYFQEYYLIVISHFETSFSHCACSDAMASSFWHVLFINGPHGGFLNNMPLSQGDEMRLPWISPRSRTKSFTKSPTYSAQFAHNFISILVMHLRYLIVRLETIGRISVYLEC